MRKMEKWVKNRILQIILALEMVSVPLCVRASPIRDCLLDSWTKEYMNLLPWVKRISAFLIIMGAVKMAEGYGKDGAYGIAKGVVYMISGGILYAAYV